MNIEEYIKNLLSSGEVDEETATSALKYLKKLPKKIQTQDRFKNNNINVQGGGRDRAISFVISGRNNHNYSIRFNAEGFRLIE